MSAGKGTQSKGNAIERACKNYLEICNHQLNEDIFPYLIFVTGCDLDDGSSISDRLTGMTRGGPFNRLTVRKVCGHELASIFINVDPLRMKDIILRMLTESLNHYGQTG